APRPVGRRPPLAAMGCRPGTPNRTSPARPCEPGARSAPLSSPQSGRSPATATPPRDDPRPSGRRSGATVLFGSPWFPPFGCEPGSTRGGLRRTSSLNWSTRGGKGRGMLVGGAGVVVRKPLAACTEEVLPQRAPLVLAAHPAAAAQFRHHVLDEVLERARCGRVGDVEAVDVGFGDPLLQLVGHGAGRTDHDRPHSPDSD